MASTVLPSANATAQQGGFFSRSNLVQSIQALVALYITVLSGFLSDLFPPQSQTYIEQSPWLKRLIVFSVILFSFVNFSNITNLGHALEQSAFVFIIFIICLQFHPLICIALYFVFSFCVVLIPNDNVFVEKYVFPTIGVFLLLGILHYVLSWRKQHHAKASAPLGDNTTANTADTASATPIPLLPTDSNP